MAAEGWGEKEICNKRAVGEGVKIHDFHNGRRSAGLVYLKYEIEVRKATLEDKSCKQKVN